MKNSPSTNVNTSSSIDTNQKYNLGSLSSSPYVLTNSHKNLINNYPEEKIENGDKNDLSEHNSPEKIKMVSNFKENPQNNFAICDVDSYNHLKFHQLLSMPFCDMKCLYELSWNGIPWCVRGKIWRILTGYAPAKLENREETLIRKHQEYQNFVKQYFCYRNNSVNDEYYRQITIDIPRTHPNLVLLQNQKIIDLYERVLFIWAIRHPACGYVQGINDLIAPILIVYLYEYLGKNYDVDNISKFMSDDNLSYVESDIYWTFSHLLDGIQDNYTPDQPGIQKRVRLLEKIISFADKRLYQFLTNINIQFLQFSLRWMNNLLVREIPIECTIRLWDTYFSENDGFDQLHLFVCAAFLIKFSSIIVRLQDFQEVSYFIQNLPTHAWTEEDIAVLLAEAFQLQFLYSNMLERE